MVAYYFGPVLTTGLAHLTRRWCRDSGGVTINKRLVVRQTTTPLEYIWIWVSIIIERRQNMQLDLEFNQYMTPKKFFLS